MHLGPPTSLKIILRASVLTSILRVACASFISLPVDLAQSVMLLSLRTFLYIELATPASGSLWIRFQTTMPDLFQTEASPFLQYFAQTGNILVVCRFFHLSTLLLVLNHTNFRSLPLSQGFPHTGALLVVLNSSFIDALMFLQGPVQARSMSTACGLSQVGSTLMALDSSFMGTLPLPRRSS